MRSRRAAGFTIIDLIILLLILALLAAIALPAVLGVQTKAKQKRCGANLREMLAAHMMYMEDFGTVPQKAPGVGAFGKHYFAFFVASQYLDPREVFCPQDPVHGVADPDVTTPGGFPGDRLWADPSHAGRDGLSPPAAPDTPAVRAISYDGRREFLTEPRLPSSLPFSACEVGEGDRHGGVMNVGFYDGHVESPPYRPDYDSEAWGPNEIDLRDLTDEAG